MMIMKSSLRHKLDRIERRKRVAAKVRPWITDGSSEEEGDWRGNYFIRRTRTTEEEWIAKFVTSKRCLRVGLAWAFHGAGRSRRRVRVGLKEFAATGTEPRSAGIQSGSPDPLRRMTTGPEQFNMIAESNRARAPAYFINPLSDGWMARMFAMH
jgi:hypothetical protein